MIEITVCQRPKRALSISTTVSSVEHNTIHVSVNALNGLFPFLRSER